MPRPRQDARRRIPLGKWFALIITVGAILYFALPPPGPRSLKVFDPPRLADLELRMWQAYYGGERARLFVLLVTMLREQYHYSWAVATKEAFYLARAAVTFRGLRANYESEVLPDLEQAYDAAKAWLHADFDPRAVARAELAWWVARRLPGQNGAEQVGELMADEYALLYDVPRQFVFRSALLRAEAGALRDATAEQPDWDAIGRLLRESYRELSAAVSTTTG